MSMTKLQVPIDRDVRDKLEQRATKLGFDSVQAYIRFWAKAEVDGRQVNLGEDDWGQPSDKAAARINRWAEEAKKGIDVTRPFDTPEEFLQTLRDSK